MRSDGESLSNMAEMRFPKLEPFEGALMLGAVVVAAMVLVVSFVYAYGRTVCSCGLSWKSFRRVFVVANARFRLKILVFLPPKRSFMVFIGVGMNWLSILGEVLKRGEESIGKGPLWRLAQTSPSRP